MKVDGARRRHRWVGSARGISSPLRPGSSPGLAPLPQTGGGKFEPNRHQRRTSLSYSEQTVYTESMPSDSSLLLGDYVPCKPVLFFVTQRHFFVTPAKAGVSGGIAMRPEMPAFRVPKKYYFVGCPFRVPTKYYFVGCPFAGMTDKERRSYAVSEFPSNWVCKAHDRLLLIDLACWEPRLLRMIFFKTGVCRQV